jgi:hypothetical protein
MQTFAFLFECMGCRRKFESFDREREQGGFGRSAEACLDCLADRAVRPLDEGGALDSLERLDAGALDGLDK